MDKETYKLIVALSFFAALNFIAGYLLRWFMVPETEIIYKIQRVLVPYTFSYL